MPLDRGIIVTQTDVDTVSLPHNQTTIGIVGTVANPASPTAPNTPVLVQNTFEVSKYFGNRIDGTPPTPEENSLLDGINILHRYGAGRIVAVNCGTTLNDGAVSAGLDILPKVFSVLGAEPSVLIVPRMPVSDGYLNKLIEVCNKLRAIAIVGIVPTGAFDTVDKLIAARKGSAGIGKSDERIIYTYGEVVGLDNKIEEFSSHIAGVTVRQDTVNYGRSPGNRELMGVKAYNPPISMSYTDENADTEKITDMGVMCINRRAEGFVSWGDRNSSYPKSVTALSFINVVRIRDAITRMAQSRARPFVDWISERRTGDLIASTIADGLAEQVLKGSIRQGATAEFIEAESDYAIGRLVVALYFIPYIPLQIIDIRPILKMSVSVTPQSVTITPQENAPIMRSMSFANKIEEDG